MYRDGGIKVAIYGAGAMGTVLGAFLTEGGVKADLISRNKEHIAALKERGAHIVCSQNGVEKRIEVNALLPEEMTEKYDVIFLMTKQKDNASIASFLTEYLQEDGVICTTQNGLPEEGISKIIGREKTYGAAVSFGATFIGKGSVELTSALSAMSMEVGGYLNDGKKTGLLTEILSVVGSVCGNPNFVKGTENLAGARWSKLAINSAFSGLSVVTGLTFGEIAKRKKSKKLAIAVIRECLSVARAAGVTPAKMSGHDMEKLLCGKGFIASKKAELVLPIAMKKHARLLSGMLKDVQNGRKCEIDLVNGAVVKAGATLNVETPYCRQIVELVHGIENGLYEISYENLDFFNL